MSKSSLKKLEKLSLNIIAEKYDDEKHSLEKQCE